MQINSENKVLVSAATIANLVEIGGSILAEIDGNEIVTPNPEGGRAAHYDAMAASINRVIAGA